MDLIEKSNTWKNRYNFKILTKFLKIDVFIFDIYIPVHQEEERNASWMRFGLMCEHVTMSYRLFIASL